MRSAKGRRRVWRAPEEPLKKLAMVVGSSRTEEVRRCNESALHLVLLLLVTTTAIATAAMRLQ